MQFDYAKKIYERKSEVREERESESESEYDKRRAQRQSGGKIIKRE